MGLPESMPTVARGKSSQIHVLTNFCMFTRIVPAKLSRKTANLSCVDVFKETGHNTSSRVDDSVPLLLWGAGEEV